MVIELLKSGYDVTVLTRDTERLSKVFPTARIVAVNYDSDASLTKALQDQDAVVSTVAMSAISNQPRLIDAAIAAGVRYFIPAEYTVNSRDATAQAQPMMASVVAIQQYLATKEDQINWFVINCGALLEFILDHPILLDFDKHTGRLWDHGEGAISLSDIPLLARAVAAVLRQPDKVVDHRVKVHGGTITQNAALALAKQHSSLEWPVQAAHSQSTYNMAMQKLRSGSISDPAELMHNLMIAYAAATFGNCDGHFESAYAEPDNGWLGVDLFTNNEIEEAIRKRVTLGTWAEQSGTSGEESMKDVSGGLAEKFKEGR